MENGKLRCCLTADKMDPLFPSELIVYHKNSSLNVDDKTSTDFLPHFQKREVKPSAYDTILSEVCVGREICVILTSGHCCIKAYTYVWLFFSKPPDRDPR